MLWLLGKGNEIAVIITFSWECRWARSRCREYFKGLFVISRLYFGLKIIIQINKWDKNMCGRLDGPCVWRAGREACCGRADVERTSGDDEVKWQGCKRSSVVTGRPVSPRSWGASWALTRLTCEAWMRFLHACLDFGLRPTVIFIKCSEHERALVPKTRMTRGWGETEISLQRQRS